MIVNCVAYVDGRRAADLDVDGISAFLAGDGGRRFVWVGVTDPTPAELDVLQAQFALPELAVEDTGRGRQRPKLEEYGTTLFLVVKTLALAPRKAPGGRAPPTPDAGDNPEDPAPAREGGPRASELRIGETHVYAGPRFVLSVRRGSELGYTGVRARIEDEPELLAHGPGFVVYALLDFIVDHYFPVLAELDDELDRIEDRMFRRAAMRHTTQQLYLLKRRLMRVRRAVGPLEEMGAQLLGARHAVIDEAIRPYFRDVFDHVARLSEEIDAMREMVTTGLQVNLSLITVSDTEVTKRLAAWGAIIAVPTMVGAVYGMNFRHMPELDWTLGYPLSLLGMAAGCTWLYWRFRKARWL